MILWGLYAGLYLQKPIVWTRLRPGVPFFGASHPFRRPFLRSISGGSHRPAHKNSRAFSSFLCTALAFFPRSCYTTHEVASFKPMLQVCICALLPMQPYTPHGDSNLLCGRCFAAGRDATLYPARGQQHREGAGIVTLRGMQPYTPHGDSNYQSRGLLSIQQGCNLIPRTGTATLSAPHPLQTLLDATLYPARGQQRPMR